MSRTFVPRQLSPTIISASSGSKTSIQQMKDMVLATKSLLESFGNAGMRGTRSSIRRVLQRQHVDHAASPRQFNVLGLLRSDRFLPGDAAAGKALLLEDGRKFPESRRGALGMRVAGPISTAATIDKILPRSTYIRAAAHAIKFNFFPQGSVTSSSELRLHTS